HAAVVILLACGLLLPIVAWALSAPGDAASPSAYFLLALAPALALLGYTHARALIRWAGEESMAARQHRFVLDGLFVIRLAVILFLAFAVGIVGWATLPTVEGGSASGSLWLVLGVFAGYWLLGVTLACLATFANLLVRSLRPTPLQQAAP